MADPFSDASSTVDDSQRQLLAALAEGGTQGRQRFEASQAQLRADKEAAVKQALLESALRGAPAAMQQLTASRISAPYDQRISDLGTAQSDLERRLAGMQASGQQYFAEAKGAIPVIQAQALRDAQAREAAAAAKAARASGADRGALYELNRELGGIKNANQWLLDQSDQFVHQARQQAGVSPTNPDASRQAHEAYDESMGLPSGYSYGLARARSNAHTDKYGKAANLSDGAVHQIRTSKHYADATAIADGLVGDGVTTRAQFIRDINSSATFRDSPGLRRLVIAEYSAAFPTTIPKKSHG